MDKVAPNRHQSDPGRPAGGALAPEAGADGEPASETLMEALAAVISVDPETGHIDGCLNDFQVTEAVLRRHHQEHVAAQVIDLLRAQGALCDCEVLLNSRMDLVFLESDLEFADADEAEDTAAALATRAGP